MKPHTLIGRTLGNYEIIALLGEGGMGAVFEARHRFLEDRAAIKVLHGTYSSNKQMAQRFFQEAKAARDIGHTNIIKVIDFGQADDGSLYLVMELLEGRSLAHVIAGGTVSEEYAATVAASVAEGLAAAHAKGVVHRDLKPDNIFVVGEGVKILDFGIAKVISSSANTGSSALLGTPRYMAPEQARGAKHVGPHTDVYALGVILFQMVTGRLPFDGTEIPEVLLKIVMEPPPRPSEIAPVSPEMEAVILACLAKDPAQRPPTMDALRSLLARWAGPPLTQPVRVSHDARTFALARSPVARAEAATITGSNGQVEAKSQETARVPSRRLVVALGAVAVFLLVGAGTWMVLRPGNGPSTPSASTGTQAAPPPIAEKPKEPASPPAAPILTAPAPPAPVRAVPATTMIRSEPPGAHVFIDGTDRGPTPLEVSDAAPFAFILKLKGYEDTPGKVDRAGDAPSRQLAPKPSKPSVGVKSNTVPTAPSKPAKKGTVNLDEETLD